MNHRAIPILVLSGLLLISALCTAEEVNPEFDSFLEVYTATWNTHDGEALAELFTADADFVMGSLPRVSGRKAVGAAWNAYFARIDPGRKGAFSLISLKDISPQVRLVNIDSTTSGVNVHGEQLETRLARGSWVLVKSHGTWLITAMVGLPAEGEQRTRPGEDR